MLNLGFSLNFLKIGPLDCIGIVTLGHITLERRTGRHASCVYNKLGEQAS